MRIVSLMQRKSLLSLGPEARLQLVIALALVVASIGMWYVPIDSLTKLLASALFAALALIRTYVLGLAVWQEA